MWSRYLHLLETRPLLTKCVTSATLYVGGDALAQKLDGTWERQGYDIKRGRTALIWGGILFAPAAHVWYNRILNPLIPGTTGGAVFKKVLVDQTVWTIPANAAYLTVSGLLLGKSFQQSKTDMQNQLPDVLQANWLTWPFIQAANFRFTPPALQVPVINVCILGWSCFLAIKANEPPAKKIEEESAREEKDAKISKALVAFAEQVVDKENKRLDEETSKDTPRTRKSQ